MKIFKKIKFKKKRKDEKWLTSPILHGFATFSFSLLGKRMVEKIMTPL